MGDAPLRPGDVLAGKYRVERVLGQGNMGVVVAATNLGLGQLVALKFLLPGRHVGQEELGRFLREGRAAARLKSQHVTRVLDVGTLDDGAPYTVMECLEGRDLKAILVERGPLPIVDAIEYSAGPVEHAARADGLVTRCNHGAARPIRRSGRRRRHAWRRKPRRLGDRASRAHHAGPRERGPDERNCQSPHGGPSALPPDLADQRGSVRSGIVTGGCPRRGWVRAGACLHDARSWASSHERDPGPTTDTFPIIPKAW